MTTTLDRRLHAFRPDLANETLRGEVQAERYVAGEPAQVTVPVSALRPAPDLARGIDTELLIGETVRVFDRADGWAWVQADEDGYVGYLPQTAIGPVSVPTHRIVVPRSFLYPEPELRKPHVGVLSMGSRIRIVAETETRGNHYHVMADGTAVMSGHCRPIGEELPDYVAVASRFIETPYLWGGRSGIGIDCSGLTQLALMMTGRKFPRDTDMQAKMGEEIARGDLRHGDLVFWKGHVGLMEDEETLLHANGHTMTVARENFEAAVARIGWLYGQPTGFRRIV